MAAAWWLEAARLSEAGLTYEQIGRQLGQKSRTVETGLWKLKVQQRSGKPLVFYRGSIKSPRLQAKVPQVPALPVRPLDHSEVRRLLGKRMPLTQIAAHLKCRYRDIIAVLEG